MTDQAMNQNPDPRAVLHRSIRRAFGDGVEEIYLGLLLMITSAMYLFYYHLPRSSSDAQAVGVVISVLPWSLMMVLIAFRKRLKEAYVFPRTGYVAFRTCKWRKAAVVGAGALTLAFALMVFFWKPLLLDLASVSGLLTGAVFAVALLWGGLMYGFPHLTSLAGFSVLVGSLTFISHTGGTGALWVMLVMGSALAVAGALRFGIFVKTHPVAEDRQ